MGKDTAQNTQHISQAAKPRRDVVLMVVANAFTTATRVRREVRSVGQEGYAVQALCWDRQGRHLRREVIDNCHVRNVRFGRTQALPSSRVYYLLAAVFFQVVTFFWVLKWVKRAGTVLLHAHDFNTLLGCSLAKRLLRNHVRLIYDCHELTWGLYFEWCGPLVAGIVNALEVTAVSEADAIISVNEAVNHNLTYRHSIPALILYNCPAKSEIPPFNSHDAKMSLGLNDTFVVLFSGWVRQDYDFESILKAAHYFRKAGLDDVRFVFVGPPEAMDLLKRSVAAENLQSFFDFRGWVPDHELMKFYLASEICYAVSRKLGPSSEALTPIKMFESMACGLPVAVREETLAARIVQFWRCGIVVGPQHGDFLTQLVRLMKDPQELRGLGAAGKEAFTSSFNWDRMAEKMLQLYSELSTRHP